MFPFTKANVNLYGWIGMGENNMLDYSNEPVNGDFLDIVYYISQKNRALNQELEIITFLRITGYFLKIIKAVKHEWTPFLILIISLLFTHLKLRGYTVDNLVPAVLVTGAAVLGNQFEINVEKLLK